MNDKVTNEDLQFAAATLITMRQQLGLEDDMIYNLVVDTKDHVRYTIKCEKVTYIDEVLKEVKDND